MNEEQRKMIQEAIESNREAIEMLEDDELMDAIFESLAEIERGERGVRLSEIKFKPARARRISA